MKAPRSTLVALPTRPEVSETYLLMAAAEMDARGRLFAPKEPGPEEPTDGRPITASE